MTTTTTTTHTAARWLLAALALIGVSLGGASAHAELNVVATLPDLAAIAREVGGDHVTVTALAKPTEDPHYVDPRPNLILKLNKADLLIINGLELEGGWLPPLQTQARNADINVGGAGFLNASQVVNLMQVQAVVDRSMGDVHPGGNPHFTFDPRAAVEIARAIGAKMAALDPDHAAAYTQRADRLINALKALAQKQAERFAALPASQRRVVVYHQSMPYLLDWLNIDQVATVEPRPGIKPNPSHVASVLKTMKAKEVGVIVQEEFYPRKTSSTLARLAKGQVVVLHGGTRFDDGQTYVKHLETLAEALYGALSK